MLKKIHRISKKEFILLIGLIVMIMLLAGGLLYELKRKSVVDDLNYLAFVYHLGLSTNDDGIYVVSYDKALSIQKDVIKNLSCSRNKDYCYQFDGKLVSGAFIEISYINHKVDSIKLYSKRVDFIFNNNVSTQPYSKGLFPPQSITQSESFRYGRSNTLAIADMMNHVSHEYYLETNLNKPITESECALEKDTCFDVLVYEKKS